MNWIFTLVLLFAVAIGYASDLFTRYLRELDQKGFTLVENVWGPQDLEQFRQGLEQAKQRAFALIENTPPQQRIFFENEQRNESKYWRDGQTLVMQAGEGRFDFYLGFESAFFPTRQVNQPLLNRLMQELLGGEFTHNAGVVLASPGGKDQYWHRDTHTLSNRDTTGAQLVAL
ncbi:MAG: phytanoyl-CoA dioxygenase family protein, partial [Verrucomicrobia bacterium]|nr:phytanoyl-CoA dioxygenase family protein [Verrucomicrobiota bacterium]